LKPYFKLHISLTCRAAPWHGVSGDDSRVTQTAEVQAVAVVVVLAKKEKKRNPISDTVLKI